MRQLLLLLGILTLQAVNAQKVGIGTATPTEKLHVAGNIKADTLKPNVIRLTPNAGAGKVLTSDGVGNASWQGMQSSGLDMGFGSWGDCATNSSISDYQPVADSAGTAVDLFGNSISISGNYAIIGVPLDDGPNTDQGSASIYHFDGVSWVHMQKLLDPTGATEDLFGYSVSISGNYAIIGSPLDNGTFPDQGSASIFQFDGNNWVFMQKLLDAAGEGGDLYGASVSLSGNYAIVGAYNDDAVFADQGSASIYRNISNTWTLMQKIISSSGALSDNMGFSVSVSGQYAMIGAPLDDSTFVDQGSVSVYLYTGMSWILTNKLVDDTGEAGDGFGNTVAISGNYAVIGSPYDQVDANQAQGSASFYRYNGSNWTVMQKLSDVTGEAFDHFGISLSISGSLAIIGANFKVIGTNLHQGAAIIYRRVGIGWQRIQEVIDPAGNAEETLGSSTGIDGTTRRFIISAPAYTNSSGKAIFGKVN